MNETSQIPALSTGIFQLFICRSQRDDLIIAFRYSDGQKQGITLISNHIAVVLCPLNLGSCPPRTGRGRVVSRVVEATSGLTLNPTCQSYLLLTKIAATPRKMAHDLVPNQAQLLPSRHCFKNLCVTWSRRESKKRILASKWGGHQLVPAPPQFFLLNDSALPRR